MQAWKAQRETRAFLDLLRDKMQELLIEAMRNIDQAGHLLPMARGIESVINYLEDREI